MIALQILLFIFSLAIGVTFILNARIKNASGYTTGFRPAQLIIGGLIPAIVLIGIIPAFGEVSAGNKGVVLRFGAVTGKEVGEGLYFITPFFESMEQMNVQTHAEVWEVGGASRDLQDVATKVTLNYHLDTTPGAPSYVYRHLRKDYVQRVMVPTIKEAVKATTARFDAEKLIVERPNVKAGIEDYLRKSLEPYKIKVDGVSITDFAFSESFSNAIEAKVTATQEALKAENDLRRIKAEAQQQIETAKAGAEAIRIQAQAINSQGGRDYVSMKAIEKWDGSLPNWITSGGAMPFITVPAPSGGK